LVNNFFLNHIKSRSSLPQVGCARGANTFLSHNQSLTRKSLIKTSTFRFPSNLESNTRWRLSNQANEFKLPSTPRGDVWQHWYMGRIYQWIHSLRFNESRKHLASFFPFILGPKIRVGQNLDTHAHQTLLFPSISNLFSRSNALYNPAVAKTWCTCLFFRIYVL
jgi:hypothetical protein